MTVVFISYSGENLEQARSLRQWLRSHGFHEVFQSSNPVDGIGAARDWRNSIQRAIRRSDVVLLLISSDWLGSNNCARELELALMFPKRIIPIRLDKTPIESLPSPIERRQICDLSDMACEDEGYAKLLRALPQEPFKLSYRWLAVPLICTAVIGASLILRPIRPAYWGTTLNPDTAPVPEVATPCAEQDVMDRLQTANVTERLSCLESYLCDSRNYQHVDEVLPLYCIQSYLEMIVITTGILKEVEDSAPLILKARVETLRVDMIPKQWGESERKSCPGSIDDFRATVCQGNGWAATD